MLRVIWVLVLTALLALLAFGDDKLYKVGDDGVSPPEVMTKTNPEYTESAKAEGIEGMVVLRVEISKEGVPENIKVEKSLRADLDGKAVEAVQNWKFKPARKGGEPVRVYATIEINFRLKK